MNPVIDGEGRGRCRRSKPRRKSGTGVVAATMMLAATPSVPLIRMFHAAPEPLDRQGEAEHVDPLALPPMNGAGTRRTATNGSSITRRSATKPTREIGEPG